MDTGVPSSPGKFKSDRPHHHHQRLLLRWHHSSLPRLLAWLFFSVAVLFALFLISSHSSSAGTLHSSSTPERRSLRTSSSASWGGPKWEKRVQDSRCISRCSGISVLVTGATGFVGTHVSHVLKLRGDGMVGLDNFNGYYDPSLQHAREDVISRIGIFMVKGTIYDALCFASSSTSSPSPIQQSFIFTNIHAPSSLPSHSQIYFLSLPRSTNFFPSSHHNAFPFSSSPINQQTYPNFFSIPAKTTEDPLCFLLSMQQQPIPFPSSRATCAAK